MVLYGNQLVHPLDIDEIEIYWKSTTESDFTFAFCHIFLCLALVDLWRGIKVSKHPVHSNHYDPIQ